MALVKKDRDTTPTVISGRQLSQTSMKEAELHRKRARTLAKQQQVAERIAAATSQLASGITEASSAVEELKRATDQIATGAQEASGAAQESLTAFKQVVESIKRQQHNCEIALSKSEAAQTLVSSACEEIKALVDNINVAAERQMVSVQMVTELEKQASNIGDIVKAVGKIADQTNLLALNAAIEAARAGKHGKGFAVVADEVRTLAETSERSAQQIQELVAEIQQKVKVVTEGINKSATTVQGEVEKGKTIMEQLSQIESGMSELGRFAQDIATGAQQSTVAAQQALKGSENIATAAEEQASAAEEVAKTVAEQSQALLECEQAAQSLSELAEDLKNSTDIGKSAEEVASAAEELSTAVQEINKGASEIMVALEQIRKGAEIQAAGTEESSAAVSQIEKGLQLAKERATVSAENIENIIRLLVSNKEAVSALISGIVSSVDESKNILKQVKELKAVSRKIDKIVDAITTVSIQTSMLAVNGAIEAARAGEFGKGFAVVASDIRNLAHDSAENADRIKDLVKAVQEQISIVNHDIEEIMENAMSEANNAKVVTDKLNQTENSMAEIDKESKEILNSADEIATAIVQIKKGVEQIAATAQEAEKAAEEAAAAAKQQAQGAEELAAAIEEIASLADELQST